MTYSGYGAKALSPINNTPSLNDVPPSFDVMAAQPMAEEAIEVWDEAAVLARLEALFVEFMFVRRR